MPRLSVCWKCLVLFLLRIRWSTSWSNYCKYNSQVMFKSKMNSQTVTTSYSNDYIAIKHRFSLYNSNNELSSSIKEKASFPAILLSKTTYFLSKWRSVLSSRNFISASLAWIAMIISTGFPRRAIAATAVDSLSRAGTILNPSGWDLFGRVPFDDFLFSTWQLTEPNLLRRTMQEAVCGLTIIMQLFLSYVANIPR